MHHMLLVLLVAAALPEGNAPDALVARHFPDALHAFVWRNWQVTPVERMAATVGAQPEEILALGRAMGLADPPAISDDQWRRSYITVIRRNWHLLPFDQMLTLLGWTSEQLEFTLREDDVLFTKLGLLKPKCAPIRYAPPSKETRERERQIAAIVAEEFPDGVGPTVESLFHFVQELSTPPKGPVQAASVDDSQLRYCYSYFATFGDPLFDDRVDPYPDGYLARLRAAGVNGIWLQGILFKLAPFPWDPAVSEGYEKRLENLNRLIARAKRHGIGVYLYLNEPRSMPLAFFDSRPELKGVVEGDYAALCTSNEDVRKFVREGVASVCRAAPDLAGFFTITASENLTNCWSHYQGAACPRCSARPPAEVVTEVPALINQGMKDAGHQGRMIAWDWGWQDAWAIDAINALPTDVAHMSVSEWSLPITRGGVANTVGEYSISAVGPGPRATKHWAAAQARGMKTLAKIQAGTTWELGSVPYIPALEQVAEHAVRLRGTKVDGLMLGWTLGGYPSPNLEVVAQVASGKSADEALDAVAEQRFGDGSAKAVRSAWKKFSTAFAEFPYDGSVVYNAPHHVGPANLLWGEPTGYRATMVGIPYDDLDTWRGPYPVDVFAAQFTTMSDGFEQGVTLLSDAATQDVTHRGPLERERNVAEAIAIHYRSVANQTRFVSARNRLAAATDREQAEPLMNEIEQLLKAEIDLARRLYAIQSRDSRIGFEATNQYFYVPMDLAEKVLNCRDLLDHWLPEQRMKFGAIADGS
ncbi:MAG: hypothetical protein WD851_05025 [Pirellulales bacterium]